MERWTDRSDPIRSGLYCTIRYPKLCCTFVPSTDRQVLLFTRAESRLEQHTEGVRSFPRIIHHCYCNQSAAAACAALPLKELSDPIESKQLQGGRFHYQISSAQPRGRCAELVHVHPYPVAFAASRRCSSPLQFQANQPTVSTSTHRLHFHSIFAGRGLLPAFL